MIHRIVLKAVVVALALSCDPSNAAQPVSSLDEAAETLARDLADALHEGNVHSVALVPFEDQAGALTLLGNQVQNAIQDFLVASKPRFQVLERGEVDLAIEELKRGRSDFFDRELALELGKLIAAETLIRGSLDTSGSMVRFSARILDVETSANLGGAIVHLERSKIADELFRREIPRSRSNQAPRRIATDTPTPIVSVHRTYRHIDARAAVVVLLIENPSDQSIAIAFAKADFGKCDVTLRSKDGREYRLIDDSSKRRSETEIGSGGLGCAGKNDPRTAYTLIGPDTKIHLPLGFRANVNEEMTRGPLTLSGELVRYRAAEARQEIPLYFPDLEPSVP